MVSIIIPLYNAEDWIERTIASCLAQKPFVNQIIIVDNGSIDRSVEIIESIINSGNTIIEIWKIPQNGSAYARNFGLSKAKGRYIQWLDADDQLIPGKFDAQIKCFTENSNADIVYSNWTLHTYKKGLIDKEEIKIERPKSDFLKELLLDNWLPPHAYLLKRETALKLEGLGLWNIKTKVLQDREYFTMAAIIGSVFHYCETDGVIYNRWSKSSISQNASIITRMESLRNLMIAFKEAINQHKVDRKKAKEYIKIIHANLLIANMNLKISDGPPPKIYDIAWTAIGGKWTKLKMLCWYFYWCIKPGNRNFIS